MSSLGIAIDAVMLAWVFSEIVLAVTRRSTSGGGEAVDRSSLRVLWIVITASVAAALALARLPAGKFPPAAPWGTIGLALIVVGIVVRWTAILSLKRAFTVDVAVAKDQAIVQHGLYSFLRHPSYTGMMLSFLGFAIALRHWTSLVALLVPITIALLYRIRVEEQALTGAFGEAYTSYARRTKRLVPFVY
jgi:protein-S-isoprenylcysteine O-methyltransferase Ste14